MKPVPSTPDFHAIESQAAAFWEAHQTFDRLREDRKDAPLFRFIDGPITANNPMGVHHAWGRTLKDVFVRYHVMNGKGCRYQNGFDCQGLWVEVEVEKELGFNGKPDIEAYGLDKFAERCRERIDKYSGIITEQSKRLGQWMDWDHSYYTHTDGNITGIWHFLKLCHENGWVYRSGLPMPWCARCGTSLSEHEMAGSYREVTHRAVYAHLPLKDGSKRRLLLWTTTPWTLSANMAAAVNPELNYSEVSHPDWDFTLVLNSNAIPRLEPLEVREERMFRGKELVGLEYETFFPEFEAQQDKAHRVIPWPEVSADEGSGIVHIAPGCGLEDYELGQEHGIPAVCPVDDSGNFVEGFGWLTGTNAQQVADEIITDLDGRGKLLKGEDYEHNYPVCWRCKHELIFRLVGEWFIRSEEVRPKLIEAARTVAWTPPHMGKRMENWLENMGDWCISRKRFWGLPLPFYECACGELNVIGSREELRQRAVEPEKVDALPELHRPWIDAVRIRCAACGGEAERVTEVGDCWLDAGIVPYSTLGYFDDRAAWERAYPAEWICEMREQVRLWFYSMLFMGVTISGRAPYEKVLAYERVVAEDGSMFSKTGYMIRFDEAVDRMGADPMRYLYCSQPVTSDLRFGYTLGDLAKRKLANLWNIYVFFTTYALIDEPDLGAPCPDDALHITDRWLRARTAAMRDRATAGYDNWDTPAVIREVEEYLDDVSNWYVRLNRRRFWRAGHAQDKRACYGTLLSALDTVVRVLAPITPFLSESIWQNAVRGLRPGATDSVHRAPWPEQRPDWRDDVLLDEAAFVRDIVVNMARNVREVAQLRVRQPLRTMYVVCPEERWPAIERHRALIKTELNVKNLEVMASSESLEQPVATLNFRAAGPVLRGDVNTVKDLLAKLDPERMEGVAAQVEAGGEVEVPGWDGALPAGIFEIGREPRSHLRAASQAGVTVALDTRIDDDLRREGTARDLVHHLQYLRKDRDLELTERVMLAFDTNSAFLQSVIQGYRDYIMEEVLAVDLEERDMAGNGDVKTLRLGGEDLHIALQPMERDGQQA